MELGTRYRIEVDTSQADPALQKTERHIEATSTAARDLGKAADEATKRLDKSFAQAEKAAEKLGREIDESIKSARIASGAWTSLAASTDKATKAKAGLSDETRTFTSLLKNVAGPAVLGFAAKSALDYANRLKDISTATGFTLAETQKLDHASRQAGRTIDDISRAMGVFQDRLAGGDDSVVGGLRDLHLDLDRIKRLNPAEQFYAIAKAVRTIPDEAERARIVTEIFGPSGRRLLALFQEDVRGLGDEFERLGGVISDDAVKAAADLGQQWDNLIQKGQGLIIRVFGAMSPAIEGTKREIDAISGAFDRLMNWTPHKDSILWNIWAGSGSVANLPNVPAAPDVLQNTGTGPMPSARFGYTELIARQQNELLREQARLHKERARAAEEASRKAEAAAKRELAAFNALIASHRSALADAQAAIGEDFDLFFGRGYTPRGGLIQGENYWGQTELPPLPSRDLGGVMGPIMPPQSAGNIANWVNYRPPMSSQERWFQQWQRQNADFSSWGEGVTSVGNAFGTYGQAVDDIIAGDTQVLRATNVRGRGNRAWKGAVAGAQEGGQYGGPYGAAGGAVAGLLIGLFRNPGFEDIMNRTAHRFGEDISEELARSIEELDKSRSDWGREESEVYSIGSTMREVGVDEANFDQMAARVRDIFVMVETGKFTVDEARQALDDSFSQLAEHVQKSTHLASEGFVELIRLNKQFGLESEAVSQFVSQQTTTLGDSIAAMAAPLVETYGGLSESITTVQDDIAVMTATGKTDTEEYATAVQQLSDLQALQAKGATEAAAEVERLGVIAVAAFNAAIESGMGYVEAVDAMGPALDTLLGLQKDLGIETQNTALADLQAFRERVNANQGLVTATEALGETMRALASIGGLNTESLAAMEAQGLLTFQRLTEAGFTENQALTMMKDFIVNVVEAHTQLGVPIDENTQKLVDQAKEMGLLKKEGSEMVDVFKEGFTAMIEAVGGKLPEEWAKVDGASSDTEQQVKADADKMAGSVGKVTDAVGITYDQLRDTNAWAIWRDAGVEAAADVEEAVNHVNFGRSPGGLKEIPIKLQEAIDAAHRFKEQAQADMAAVEDAVNALSAEQQDHIRLLLEVGRPLDDIAYLLDTSTAALERFIEREGEAARAAEEAARAVEQQRLETERMQVSLDEMNARYRDELGLMQRTGLDRTLLDLSQRERDEVAAAEAMRPTLGAAVDETIRLITEKYALLRGEAVREAEAEAQRLRDQMAAEAQRAREQAERDRLTTMGQFTDITQQLQDQIALIGKTGLERELLQLQFRRRDELAALNRYAFSPDQMALLLLKIDEKYARLEAEARGVSGAALGGYVSPLGVQYLAMGGNVLRFRPRGSDTVPAMLTPGEGVLSRRGMQTLSRLNSGDDFLGGVVIEKGAIVVQGVQDPEAVADAVMRRISQRRKFGRSRRAA